MKEKIKVKLQSIFLAALFLMVFGAVWYGILFHNVQMESHSYSVEDYANNNPIWYLGGAIISLFIAWGIGLLLRLGFKKRFEGWHISQHPSYNCFWHSFSKLSTCFFTLPRFQTICSWIIPNNYCLDSCGSNHW